MNISFDLYIPGNSWLHRLDPRVKLWAVALGLIVPFIVDLPILTGYLILIHLLLLSARIPWHRLQWIWQQLIFLLAMILLLQPFFTPSGAVWITLGPLQLTEGGMAYAVYLALRVIAMALLTSGLLFTTDQRDLVQAFVRLGMPYTWGLTISLTLRFLPAIAGLFTAVREAQASRGWISEGNFVRRTRDYLPVLIAVVIGSLRLSDDLTLALAARGLGAGPRRTVWHDLAMRPLDWIIALLVTLTFIALILIHTL